LRGCARG